MKKKGTAPDVKTRDNSRHKFKKTSQGKSRNTKRSAGKRYRGQGK